MNTWTDTLLGWLPGYTRARADGPVPDAKSGLPGGFISMYGPGQASWTARNAAAYTNEGFAANPVAYRCVTMLADAVSSLPWLMYDGDDEVARQYGKPQNTGRLQQVVHVENDRAVGGFLGEKIEIDHRSRAGACRCTCFHLKI